MSTFGVDYAWGRPGGAALAAAGVQFAMRYLSLDTSKNIDAAEVADLTAHGVAVGLVWETTARRAAAGWQAGHDDATRAAQQRDALGLQGTPIYAAVDFDVQPSEVAAVNDYFAGWNSVLPPSQTGVYGGIRAVDAVRQAGHAAYGWQTTAWSGGQWSSYAALQQRGGSVTIGGVDCDRNYANGDVGTGPAPTQPSTPAGPPWPGRYLQLQSPMMNGGDVRTFQGRLAERGWHLDVDGWFGRQTRDTVRAFQADKGLTQDGIVGPITWAAAWNTPVTP